MLNMSSTHVPVKRIPIKELSEEITNKYINMLNYLGTGRFDTAVTVR